MAVSAAKIAAAARAMHKNACDGRDFDSLPAILQQGYMRQATAALSVTEPDPPVLEIENWAMLVDEGLNPFVAKRVAEQYTERCKEVAQLDRIITFYMDRNLPAHSDADRADRTWEPEMTKWQTAALQRHLARTRK